jgi:hypothetical protein
MMKVFKINDLLAMKSYFCIFASVKDRHTDVCLTLEKALVDPLGDGSDHLTLKGFLFNGLTLNQGRDPKQDSRRTETRWLILLNDADGRSKTYYPVSAKLNNTDSSTKDNRSGYKSKHPTWGGGGLDLLFLTATKPFLNSR